MRKKIIVSIDDFSVVFRLIPKGDFLMGSTQKQIEKAVKDYASTSMKPEWLQKEYPAHSVVLPDYYMAETVVSNEIFLHFVNDSKRKATNTLKEAPKEPAHIIDYGAAEQFCLWASQKSGYTLRIPTEQEWEKAARGTDGREYPWGNTFDQNKCNTREAGINSFVSINDYANSPSPYGIIQMAGNIEEWTSSVYKPYPGGHYIEDLFDKNKPNRIIRGGKFNSTGDLARTARRHGVKDKTLVGLRLVLSL